jgi:hypothetical protein
LNIHSLGEILDWACTWWVRCFYQKQEKPKKKLGRTNSEETNHFLGILVDFHKKST